MSSEQPVVQGRATGESAALYVVTNSSHKGNDRVRKVISLRDRFNKLVHVGPGGRVNNERHLRVPPWPNPSGIFGIVGLHRLKQLIDRYLLFTVFYPGHPMLFARAVRRHLFTAIAADLRVGKQVCLLTAVPPHVLGMIGLYVKRRFPEVRWVMDWQDLWSYDENYYLKCPRIYRTRLRRLERKMLGSIDVNITTNRRAASVLRDRYAVPEARLQSIHHHFHRGDSPTSEFAGVDETHWRDDDVVRIGFFGTLFKPPRVPGAALVAAVREMRASGLKVELHIHGQIGEQAHGIGSSCDGIVHHGRTPHDETVGLLRRYDFLLVLLADLPNSRAVMSIKLPHYMISGRPIIAIVPEQSAVADIVTKTGTGVVLPVAGGAWRDGLRQLVERGDSDRLLKQRQEDEIEAYAWNSLSEDWYQAIVGGWR